MKTLNQMAGEVYDVNVDKGWFDSERTVGDGIALLHSEVSEALEAYRDHKLADATLPAWTVPSGNPKPEGVGSELADVLIRWLDQCTRDGKNPDSAARATRYEPKLGESFGDALTEIHRAISHYATIRHEYTLGQIFKVLLRTCQKFGIDLAAEYERKLAYNRTRPRRHGDRAL